MIMNQTSGGSEIRINGVETSGTAGEPISRGDFVTHVVTNPTSTVIPVTGSFGYNRGLVDLGSCYVQVACDWDSTKLYKATVTDKQGNHGTPVAIYGTAQAGGYTPGAICIKSSDTRVIAIFRRATSTGVWTNHIIALDIDVDTLTATVIYSSTIANPAGLGNIPPQVNAPVYYIKNSTKAFFIAGVMKSLFLIDTQNFSVQITQLASVGAGDVERVWCASVNERDFICLYSSINDAGVSDGYDTCAFTFRMTDDFNSFSTSSATFVSYSSPNNSVAPVIIENTVYFITYVNMNGALSSYVGCILFTTDFDPALRTFGEISTYQLNVPDYLTDLGNYVYPSIMFSMQEGSICCIVSMQQSSTGPVYCYAIYEVTLDTINHSISYELKQKVLNIPSTNWQSLGLDIIHDFHTGIVSSCFYVFDSVSAFYKYSLGDGNNVGISTKNGAIDDPITAIMFNN